MSGTGRLMIAVQMLWLPAGIAPGRLRIAAT